METQLMLAHSESLLWKQSLQGILEEVYCFWWCSSCCHFVMAVSALWFCYCIILFFLFIVFKVTMLVLGLFYLLVLSIWLFIYIVTLRLLSTRLLNAALSLKSQSMWNRISLRKAERRRKESGLPIHYYFFFDFVWTWIDGVFFFLSIFFFWKWMFVCIFKRRYWKERERKIHTNEVPEHGRYVCVRVCVSACACVRACDQACMHAYVRTFLPSPCPLFTPSSISLFSFLPPHPSPANSPILSPSLHPTPPIAPPRLQSVCRGPHKPHLPANPARQDEVEVRV